MIAKDFQEATANRIVELFRQGHNRVLLADEVGLGKTIVAKTVVEKHLKGGNPVAEFTIADSK
jgi:type I site-specific restriction endonuclease